MRKVVFLVALLLAIPAGSFADIYSENFDSMANGAVPAGWMATDTGMVLVSNADPYSTANAMKLSNKTTNYGAPCQAFTDIPAVTGQDVTFSLKFKYTESSYETAFMLGLASGYTNLPGISNFLLKTGGSGNQWVYCNLGQVTAALYSEPAFDHYVSMTQQYNWNAGLGIYDMVRVTFTAADGFAPWWWHVGEQEIPPFGGGSDPGGSQCSSIWYDNDLTAWNVSSFDKICFQSAGDDLTGYLYIDNLQITPEPATMMLLGLGGLVLRRFTK